MLCPPAATVMLTLPVIAPTVLAAAPMPWLCWSLLRSWLPQETLPSPKERPLVSTSLKSLWLKRVCAAWMLTSPTAEMSTPWSPMTLEPTRVASWSLRIFTVWPRMRRPAT